MCAGASGQGFLPGHTWEDILLPVFGDNEEMNVVIRPLVILVAWRNVFEDKKKEMESESLVRTDSAGRTWNKKRAYCFNHCKLDILFHLSKSILNYPHSGRWTDARWDCLNYPQLKIHTIFTNRFKRHTEWKVGNDSWSSCCYTVAFVLELGAQSASQVVSAPQAALQSFI